MTEPLEERKDVTVVLILFTLLAMAGILGGNFIVRDYARARASISWPSVEGVVLSQHEGEGALRYAYSFDGRNYESKRHYVFSAQFFERATADYAPGDSVTVYIDPEHHRYSIIQHGAAGGAFVLFSLLSGVCLFLGVGGVVWALSENADTYLVFPPNLIPQKTG